MPLFLMISGFLITPGGFDVAFKEFFVRRVWPFIKLYFYFSLVGLASYLFVFRHEQAMATMVVERMKSILYASGSTDSGSDVYPIVLWYFPCSILARLIAYFVWRIPNMTARGLTFVGVGLVALFLKGRALPWEFESAMPAAGFLVLGHFGRRVEIDKKIQRLGAWHWPVAASLIAVGTWCAFRNVEYPDLRTLALGNPWLAIPATFLLSLGLPMVAMKCRPSKVAFKVASATILIFPLHVLLFPYIDRILGRLGVINEGAAWYGVVKALTAVAILAMVHVAYTLARTRIRAAMAQRRSVPVLTGGVVRGEEYLTASLAR